MNQIKILVALLIVLLLSVAGSTVYTAHRLTRIEKITLDASDSADTAARNAQEASDNASEANDNASAAESEAQDAYNRADAAATRLGE
jgi:hypothetical protein